jgi:L-ascorbate metabolism protein UlaG (beta-lactamase superfamily)
MYLTWLDSNSWLIELDGKRILLDPWLVGPLTFGGMNWLFKSDRPMPRPIPEAIDLILLSQGLEDHAHPPTLKALDRDIPVVGSPGAAKLVRELGYTQVTALAHGESFTLGEQVRIQAFPGSPIGPMLTENAYVLTGLSSQTSLYYEPHGFHSPALQQVAPIDVVITPLVNLELPLVGPVIQGKKTGLELAQWLKPQIMLPTAAGGDVTFEGLLNNLLKAVGSISEFQDSLQQSGLTTRVLEPKPGDRFQVPLAVST